MKYLAIYDSDMDEDELVEFLRKQTGSCKIMYIGLLEGTDEEISQYIEEQRPDYESKKRMN